MDIVKLTYMSLISVSNTLFFILEEFGDPKTFTLMIIFFLYFNSDHNFPDDETTADDSTRIQDERQFLHLHQLLKTIVAIVPM